MNATTLAALAVALFCLVQGSTAATTRKPEGAAQTQGKARAPPPGAGYVELPGEGHYKLHPEQLAWREAQAACEAENAHLLVLNSRKEAAAVRGMLAAATAATAKPPATVSNELHAGFFRPNYFVTVFGVPQTSLGYLKWAPGEDNAQICGSINWAILLYDAKCTDKRSFICEFKKDTNPLKLIDSPIILPDASRPIEYKPKKLINDNSNYKGLVQQGRMHYYRVVTNIARWAAAKMICEDDDAHLLVLNHQFEADTLKDHIKKITGLSDTIYVGLRDGDHKFITVFGKTVHNAGYTNWESEQPDDETCLAVDQNMLLKKVPCWEEREFICEKTLA